MIDEKSVLELSHCQVVNNSARHVAALQISNNSLLVGFNSSFKGNSAYQDSTIRNMNSTVYLEQCTFVENIQTFYGGIISMMDSTLKVANTVFINNVGYDIFYYQTQVYFINRLDTYRCLFERDNVSLKSNMSLFKLVAIRENIVNNKGNPYPIQTTTQETPYASSKMLIYFS